MSFDVDTAEFEELQRENNRLRAQTDLLGRELQGSAMAVKNLIDNLISAESELSGLRAENAALKESASATSSSRKGKRK